MIVAYQSNSTAVIISIILILSVGLNFVMLVVANGDANTEEDHNNYFEKHKYFKFEPAPNKLFGKIVIATHKNTSGLQCQHRCNRRRDCTDVAMGRENVCLLLGGGSKNENVATVGMRTIRKIKISGA